MILTVYIDESGTHENAPVMVMAGYVATIGKWADFHRKWAQVLKRYGLTYHHTKEWKDTTGEYKDWPLTKKEKFITKATKIGAQHALCGFTITLKHPDYDRHYVAGNRPKKIPLDTKYGVCFRIFLSFLPMMLKNSLDRDDLIIDVVMEAGAKGQRDTSRIFKLFKEQAPPEQAQLVNTIATADKKNFYGLQFADCLAFGAFQAEQKTPDLTHFPKDATLDDCKEIVGQRSPVFRLEVTPELLAELKDNIIAQVEARKQWGKQRHPAGETSSNMSVEEAVEEE